MLRIIAGSCNHVESSRERGTGNNWISDITHKLTRVVCCNANLEYSHG